MKRILGKFFKQRDYAGGHVLPDGEPVTFDARVPIASHCSLQTLHALEDERESTDWIGSWCVEHDGPYEVRVVDSILEYFGVSKLTDITQGQLDGLKKTLQPEELWDDNGGLQARLKRQVRAIPVGQAVGVMGERLNGAVIDWHCADAIFRKVVQGPFVEHGPYRGLPTNFYDPETPHLAGVDYLPKETLISLVSLADWGFYYCDPDEAAEEDFKWKVELAHELNTSLYQSVMLDLSARSTLCSVLDRVREFEGLKYVNSEIDPLMTAELRKRYV